jgi:hypothetical protein
MSRMVRSPLRSLRGLMRLVLCILVACLAVHFLVEDTRLPSIFSSPAPSAESSHAASSAEIDHLDDLAFQVSVPEQVIESRISHVYALTMLLKKPANFPILTPPKI